MTNKLLLLLLLFIIDFRFSRSIFAELEIVSAVVDKEPHRRGSLAAVALSCSCTVQPNLIDRFANGVIQRIGSLISIILFLKRSSREVDDK
jgi:hypothetical protein